MNLTELENYRRRQARLILKNNLTVLALAVVLCGLWFWAGGGISAEERELAASVREAQGFLYELRTSGGSEFDRADDPYRTGFIGLEWSPTTTTLGALSAKRTSCDPRWAILARRWMESLNVKPGDRVAVYSSSSFPGMAFNVLKALESLRVRPLLVVSLGASSWGANDPLFPWPVIEKSLRAAGHLRTKAFACTLGGGGEIGGGMPDEAVELLTDAAKENGVPLVVKDTLEEMIRWKMDLLEEYRPKAVISIGGSEANLGPGDDILRLRPGLHLDAEAGTGVVGLALKAGYPVIHLLNIRGLAAETGVPFDAPPGSLFHGRRAVLASICAVLLFALAMCVYKRWSF